MVFAFIGLSTPEDNAKAQQELERRCFRSLASVVAMKHTMLAAHTSTFTFTCTFTCTSNSRSIQVQS